MEGGEFEKDYWATERVCDRRRKAMEQSGEGAEKDGAENVYTPYRYGANVLQGKGADKFVTLGWVRIGNRRERTEHLPSKGGKWKLQAVER
jgi:hypothetical protein